MLKKILCKIVVLFLILSMNNNIIAEEDGVDFYVIDGVMQETEVECPNCDLKFKIAMSSIKPANEGLTFFIEVVGPDGESYDSQYDANENVLTVYNVKSGIYTAYICSYEANARLPLSSTSVVVPAKEANYKLHPVKNKKLPILAYAQQADKMFDAFKDIKLVDDPENEVLILIRSVISFLNNVKVNGHDSKSEVSICQNGKLAGSDREEQRESYNGSVKISKGIGAKTSLLPGFTKGMDTLYDKLEGVAKTYPEVKDFLKEYPIKKFKNIITTSISAGGGGNGSATATLTGGLDFWDCSVAGISRQCAPTGTLNIDGNININGNISFVNYNFLTADINTTWTSTLIRGHVDTGDGNCNAWRAFSFELDETTVMYGLLKFSIPSGYTVTICEEKTHEIDVNAFIQDDDKPYSDWCDPDNECY